MTASAAVPGRPRALAAWLGVLLAGIFALNTMGGWVRLSGSGVAIPHWPVIELGEGRYTLLPPMSAEGWTAAHGAWDEHQDRLRERIARGELVNANLGRMPADHDEFQRMFLTEWLHRAAAGLIGILALACLVTALRDPGLRRSVGAPLGIAGILIVAQAVVGGVLIEDGTGTAWLFLHQGNAAGIIGCTLWALLRLLGPAQVQRTAGVAAPLALGLCWLALVSGALVAASRHGNAYLSPAAGLALHLGIIALFTAAMSWLVRTAGPADSRRRLAAQVAASFLGVQILLGMASWVVGPPADDAGRQGALIALAHQFMGMCCLAALVLCLHDRRHERDSEPGRSPA